MKVSDAIRLSEADRPVIVSGRPVLTNIARYYNGMINGVLFDITQAPVIFSSEYKNPVIHITNTGAKNTVFLSIGTKKDKFEILKDRLVGLDFVYRIPTPPNVELFVGIKTFDEWLAEQTIFSNSYPFDKIMQSEYMKSCEDVKFILKSDTKTEEIMYHSVVLCLKSEYFLNLFNSGLSESSEKCITLSTSKEVITPIIKYIYTGEIDKSLFNSENYGFILEVYSKICEFQLEVLKPILQVFILEYLNEENLKLLNQSGILMQDEPFSKVALKFIVGRFKY